MPTFECPICHARIVCERAEEAPYRPFCSARCKLVDLGRWLNEEYRITEERPEFPEAEESPEKPLGESPLE